MSKQEFLSRLKFIAIKANKKKDYVEDCMIKDTVFLLDLYNDSNK